MTTPKIVLALVNAGVASQVWSSSCHLRIGRLSELEVSVDHLSVSRLHAEIHLADGMWVVRDRGSSNGTIVNGVRIGRTPQPIRQGDNIQIGNLVFQVMQLHARPVTVRLGQQTVQVEAVARQTWREEEDTAEALAPPSPPSKGLLRLIRAAQQLAQGPPSVEMLQTILCDAAAYFNARRGGLFLFDESTGQLTLRCHTIRHAGPVRAPGKTLAALAFRRRQSVLFKDRADAAKHEAESAIHGDMNSVICAILRVPERELGVLHLDRGPASEPFTEADLSVADTLAANLALGLDRPQLVASHEALLLQTVTVMAQAIELRDPYTGNHTQRVTAYALLLAEELGLNENDRRHLRVATLLHDIGKIAIDDQILRKPGRLSDPEFERMKTHVLRGSEIVQMIPGLSWALPVVRGHHERWDGRGYPDRLRAEEIPLPARVVAVADAFDAMTSDRPYRAGMPLARAFAELEASAGTHFDPTCVAAFLRLRPKIETFLEQEAAERLSAETGCHTISRQELEHTRKAVADADTIRSNSMNTVPDQRVGKS